jgi:hypothetical protein
MAVTLERTATANARTEATIQVTVARPAGQVMQVPRVVTSGTTAGSATQSYDLFLEGIDALIEMLDVQLDEEEFAALQAGAEAIERGDTLTWDEMKAEFGW